MELLWLPFSVATMLFYGLGQVFAKETRANIPSGNLLLILAANVLVAGVAFFVIFRESTSYPVDTWLLAVATAALSGGGYIAFYESIKHGKVSIVGTVIGAYAPWTVILALVFLNETMSLTEGIGVALVVGALLVFTYGGENGDKKTELLGLAFAVVAFFFFGTSAALSREVMVIRDFGSANFIGVYAIVCPALYVVYWLTTTKGTIKMPKSIKWTILELSTACFALGGIAYYLAIQNGPVSIVTPITNVYPLITIAVAKFRLREKLSTRQYVALAMLLVSILLFSF